MKAKQEESLNIAPINTSIISPDPGEEEEKSRQPMMWSLQDLHNSIDEVNLICLLADSDNIAFEEAIRDKKWTVAIDEEMKAIEGNEMWDLVELTK